MSVKKRVWVLMGKKVSGSLTTVEEQELDRLFQTYPDIWYMYEVLESLEENEAIPQEFMDQIQTLLKYEGNNGPAEVDNDINTSKKPVYRHLWVRAGIAAIALFAFSFVLFEGYNLYNTGSLLNKDNEIVVLNGTKTDVTLPDGSSVALNAGSKLTYSKNYASLKQREVFLSGEAYFKVIHDPRHQFIIHTAYFDIKDIGTTFNVKAYPGEKVTEASLIEGAIEVSLKNGDTKAIRLKPMQKIVLVNNSSQQNKASAVINSADNYKVVALDVNKESSNNFAETAWVNNELVFKNDTFEDLAQKMERKYNITIAFGDDKVKNANLTGVFKLETVEQALKMLQQIAPFKYQINHNNILIQSSDNK